VINAGAGLDYYAEVHVGHASRARASGHRAQRHPVGVCASL